MVTSLAVKLLDTSTSHLQEVSWYSLAKIKKISHLQKFLTRATVAMCNKLVYKSVPVHTVVSQVMLQHYEVIT